MGKTPVHSSSLDRDGVGSKESSLPDRRTRVGLWALRQLDPGLRSHAPPLLSAVGRRGPLGRRAGCGAGSRPTTRYSVLYIFIYAEDDIVPPG